MEAYLGLHGQAMLPVILLASAEPLTKRECIYLPNARPCRCRIPPDGCPYFSACGYLYLSLLDGYHVHVTVKSRLVGVTS